MNIKIGRFFITLIAGLGMILVLMSFFTISPTQAQGENCDTGYFFSQFLSQCAIEADGESPVEVASLWLYKFVADEEPTPAQVLENVYQHVLAAGTYDFAAESEQTLIPSPIPGMIGEIDQRVDMHVEGEVKMPDYSLLSVSLDGPGLDPTPVAIVQEGGRSYMLREGERIPTENPAGLTSPNGDFLSYLAAAKNVLACETEDTPFVAAVACYTYDIDGPAFAEHIRVLMQSQQQDTSGAAALGIEFAASPVLEQMTGQGKVWLDVNGLPLRQKVDLHMLQVDNYYDADVRMVIDYHFGEEAITAVRAATAAASSILPPVDVVVDTVVENVAASLPHLFVFVLFLAIAVLLILLRHRRWMYSFFAVSICIVFLTTPILQIISIDLFHNRLAHAAGASDPFMETVMLPETEQPSNAATLASLREQSLTAVSQSFQPDVYCGKGGNGDRDGDGLADDAEYCLGTNPNLDDSDNDLIPDGAEVFGFVFTPTVTVSGTQPVTHTFYTNPLNPDSNGDGVNDSDEWAMEDGGLALNWDLDGDGIPNLYDFDDDGDGVADGRDLSPASLSEIITYTKSVPTPPTFLSFPFLGISLYSTTPTTKTIDFNITGRYDGYIYVDLQVQPQDLDHLRYSMTPLDWGYDNKGQIQEHSNKVDEDIQLIPMLIVETNLAPDDDLAQDYNVTPYHDTDNNGYREMMMPLYLVGDGGTAEAFTARVAYGPNTLKNLGQAGVQWRNPRIIWMVRGTFDQENENGELTQKSSTVHTYVEPAMRITGWEVTKSGRFRNAIIGTPNMPTNDQALFQMLFGLSGSFLSYQQPDLDEINARFSGANTAASEKWGITTTVTIDLPADSYDHYDAGLADLDDRLKSFVSDHYAWDTPNSVIIAGELQSGATNMDDLGQLKTDFATNVNLANIGLTTQRSLNLTMMDGWKPITDGALPQKVMQRVQPAAKAALADLKDQYPALTETELVALTQSMYVTWENGRTRTLILDGTSSLPQTAPDQQLYEELYLTPRDRYNDPENISTLPGYLVEVGRFAQKGSGLIFSGGSAQTWQYLQSNAQEASHMGFTAVTPQFFQKANETMIAALGGTTFSATIKWTELDKKNMWFDNAAYGKVKLHIGTAVAVADTGRTFLEISKTNSATKLRTNIKAQFSKKLPFRWKVSNIKHLTKSLQKVQKAAKTLGKIGKVVGYVGLGIEIAIAIAGFITTCIVTGEFSMAALALMIAQIIVAVLLFAISTIPPWVGAVLVALLGIFDLVLSWCEACRNFFGFDSLSGWFTANLASYFYREQPLTELEKFDFLQRGTALADEDMGYVIGNRFIITDTFQGIMKVSGTKGFDWHAIKNGAIMGGGFGAVLALSDQVDLIGNIFGGPSKKENLQNSWICGEFTVQSGLKSTGTTCPDKSADYDLDQIPSNANYWIYENPMRTTVTLDHAMHDFTIILNTKITAQSRWDASTPAPPLIIPIPLGRIHWTKERTLTIPNGLSSAEKKKWEATPIYLDVLPATVTEFWNWGHAEPILTNHDPDGDGMTTKDEITAWLGSKGYTDINKFFAIHIGPTQSDLDRFLADWDTFEKDGRYDIQNFCTTYPSLSGLCDLNSSPPWLDWDTDGDGLSDKFEFDQKSTLGTNAFAYDTDGDGLSDGFEYQIGTRIDAKDSDADGLSDDVEAYHPKSDGSWDGGWDIQLPKYGPVGPNGRYWITVRVFSNPMSKDTDGDGLSDFAEKANGTSPTAFNRAPRIELTGQPTAVSPQGISAIYVKPGDLITLNTRLDVYPPYTVSTRMELALPGSAFGFPVTTQLNGSRSVPNTGATYTPGWNFANNVLQPWEYLYATTTSYTAYPSWSVVTTATLTLPFGGEGQSQEATQRIVVDVENPLFGWMTPSEGELIGGGVTHYVVGGTSSDQTTWVDKLTLNMPGETVNITDTESFSPWAYTWELPSDGIYTLNGRSHDFVGHQSDQDSVEVMIDNTAPTTDVDLEDGAVFGPPQAGSVITITLSGTANENLSGLTRVQISTDGGPWREVWTPQTATVTNTTFTNFTSNFQNRATAATWNAVWTLPNVDTVQGYHNLRVRAFDLAGNWPTYAERNIIIDVMPPTDELVNRAYLYEFPHVVANEPHTFDGVANDVGNVPQPSRPVELAGPVDGMEDATIWLGLSNIHENDAGVNVAWIGDFNGDRRGDLLVGLPAAANGDGRVAVIYGRSGNWPVPNQQEMLAGAKSSFLGITGAAIGAHVMPAGDVNGDGLADLLIGDPANNRIFLIFGKTTYFGSDLLLNGPQGSNWSMIVAPEGQQIGEYLGAAGDVNGDGYADLLIGATTATTNMAYLLLGQANPWWPSTPLNTFAAARINQAGTGMLTGVGDLNGDFRDEFAVGIGSRLYLFAGKGSYAPRAGSWMTLSSAVDSFSSADANPDAVSLGDVNGDHIDDFIYTNGSSQVLVYGDANLQDATWSTHTYNYGSGFIAAPGDVDNDGLNDILIGNGTDAYFIAGSDIAATQSTISGVSTGASAPYAAGADLNSDGSSDLLLVPTAAGSQAAATVSTDSIADLPPTWVPQLPEQTLSTYVGSTTWPPVDYADGYVNADGVCHGLTPCYTTIQTAVNAWNDDDLIIVQPGVYAPFVIDGYSHSYNRITIRGTDPDAVIIDANGSSYAARINMATGVRLEKMTLRNAGYGVQLDSAGINGHETPSYRTILDYLLIYDTGSYDVYMTRNSTVSIVNSTLARSSQHIGTYGPADPNVVVQWNSMAPSDWPIMDGGGAVLVGDTIYVERGGGNQAFGRYDIASNTWPDPWGPNNVYEDNSTIAAGSDDQVYLLGAPHWRDTSLNSDYDAGYAAGGNGVMYAKDYGDSAYYWDGIDWVPIPGSPDSIWLMAAHPVTSDLYVYDYILNEVLKWDGSSWTSVADVPFYFSDARMMEVGSDGTVYFGGSFTNIFRGDYNPTCSGQVVYADPDFGGIFNCYDYGDSASVSALAAHPQYNTIYVGGNFETEWGAKNLTTINGGSINGVSGPVYGIDVDDEGNVYVTGDFTSTLAYDGSIDQETPAKIASWNGNNWTTYPVVIDGDPWYDASGVGIAATGAGEFYAVGRWRDPFGSGGEAELIYWTGSSWLLGDIHNASNNEAVWNFAASGQGVFLSGDVASIDFGDTTVTSTNLNFLLQSPFEVYSTTLNSWHTGIVGPPMQLGDGASMAGDDVGNLVVLVGGGRTDSFKYEIETGEWSRVTGMNDPVNASAMTKGEDGYVYAVTDGPSTLYRFTGYWWEAVGPTISGVTIDDGVALAYDSHFGTYYVLPGGNGNMMLRYNPAWGSSWETLPADRNTPAGVRPGAALVFVEGEDENRLYTPQGNYTGDTSTAFWMYPLPMPNKVEFKDSIVYAQSGTSWLNYNDPLPEDFNFRVDANSRFFGGTGWTPTNMGTLPTTTDDPFLDAARDVYRMDEAGAAYTIGYHTYTAPVTATTDTGIQAMINTGANRVVVEPGIYEEDIYLVNGVEVIGTNPDWTIVRPLSGSTADALVRAAGTTGASFSRFTLDGENSGLDGFAATGNAAHLTLQRARIYDTDTAVSLNGSGTDLEVAHATIAQNTNGLVATGCASIDVRNSIFAYHTGSALSHEACAAIKLHTYNLYWANAADFGADADAGAAELFLDPSFVDPMDHDYRTLNFSPVIDAGNPTDPAPPGAGSRADIGYIEQGRVNFYVDDSYCEICTNDGLTWQVDAFDNIQDALNAAKNALANLNPSIAAVPQLVVGVAPGTYLEQVTVPSHVLLFGSGAEDTIIDAGGSGTAVTFNAVTEAGVRHMTIMNADIGVSVSGAANLIDMQRNIIRNNIVGVFFTGRATGELEYNTFANNDTGVSADGPGSWTAMMHNIVAGSAAGISAANNGQIFNDYNLLYNTVDFSGSAAGGDNDIVGQDPLFAGGSTPYRLSETSPALDAASGEATVPDGGGMVADLGYSELLAAPVTILLGQEDLSTVMGNSGVASVEYGVAPVPDPTAAVTETLPGTWVSITLDTPGETLSYWSLDYTPLDEGLYRFYSRATDMVGNQEEDEPDWYDGSFVVDSTPPTLAWLTPANGASLAAPLELRAQVSDYAAGEFSVDENDVYFEVDGQRYPATWAAEPWDESAGEPRTFRAWISPTLGAYSNVIAGAEDKAGNTATDNSMSFTVTAVSPLDTTPPTVTVSLPLPGSWVTHTVVFSGTTTDLDSGVASVELSLDGGSTWRPTTVSGDTWSLIWEGPEELPMISFPAQARATDRAGFTAVTSFEFTIDEVAPTGLIPVTFNLPEESHLDVVTDLEINWQPPVDASGIITTMLVVDQITDTILVDVVAGTTAVHSLDSNGDWYVHLAAMDAAGNMNVLHYGPWHVGLNEGLAFGSRQQSIIIDGYVDVPANEWRLDSEYLDDDERTYGSEVTYSPAGQQSFLTTWDANNYYMAWRGSHWELDGDLWIYLKAGGSGSSEMIVPLASAPDTTLPFAANYAIQITDPLSGTLYEYSGGWQVSTEEWTFAQSSSGDTEIRLPLFGTSDVETLAFGLGDDHNVWAIFPTTNALNPGSTVQQNTQMFTAFATLAPQDNPPAGGWQGYQWADITAVTNVADNQPQAVGLALTLDSLQAQQAAWAPGSTLQYVIEIYNLETEIVSGQPISLTAVPAAALIHDSIEGAACSTTNPWECTLDPLAPGLNTITLTTHLATDLSSVDAVTMAAALTGENLTSELVTEGFITHQIDSAPPEVTVIASPFVGLGSTTFNGTATDGDGVGVDYVEVRPEFGGWQRVEGTELWTVDLTVSPFAQHGDTWQFEVRAADLHGQISTPQVVTFTVDLQGPAVTFDSPTELSGNLNEIMGTITDVPTSSEAAEVTVQLDDEPWREAVLFAPDAETGEQPFLWTWNMPTEDGVTHTLRVQTVDLVGNPGSLAPAQQVWVDNVTPVLTVTDVLTQVAVQHYYPGAQIGGPVLSGSVTDGTGVAAVQVWVEKPNGDSYQDTAVLTDDTWQYTPGLQTLGMYKLQVRTWDTLGNQTQTTYYDLEVMAAPDSGPNQFTTAEDTPITFEPLLDDFDLDSEDIFLDDVADPTHGTVTISGTAEIVYTPTLNFNGMDVFTYTASDGQWTDTATVTVTVLPVNDPPQISQADTITATMDEDGGTLAFSFNAINVDDDTLTWTTDEGMGTAVITRTYGTGNLNADVAYTPELDFGGIDTFRMRVSDGQYTDEVTVVITVNPVDDAPRAADDYVVIVAGDSGKPMTLDVMGNDEEVDGQTLLLDGVGTPSQGSLAQISGDQIVYTPTLALGETETVSYTVSDGGLTDTAVLHVSAVAGDASGRSGETIAVTDWGANDAIDLNITIPANVGHGDEQVTLVLGETAVSGDAPAGFMFAGISFVLNAYVDGVLTSPYQLAHPITLEISYSDADVADIGKGDDELALYYWSGSEWLADGITVVERDTAHNRLVVTINHLTEFALFGKDMMNVYLPFVIKP